MMNTRIIRTIQKHGLLDVLVLSVLCIPMIAFICFLVPFLHGADLLFSVLISAVLILVYIFLVNRDTLKVELAEDYIASWGFLLPRRNLKYSDIQFTAMAQRGRSAAGPLFLTFKPYSWQQRTIRINLDRISAEDKNVLIAFAEPKFFKLSGEGKLSDEDRQRWNQEQDARQANKSPFKL